MVDSSPRTIRRSSSEAYTVVTDYKVGVAMKKGNADLLQALRRAHRPAGRRHAEEDLCEVQARSGAHAADRDPALKRVRARASVAIRRAARRERPLAHHVVPLCLGVLFILGATIAVAAREPRRDIVPARRWRGRRRAPGRLAGRASGLRRPSVPAGRAPCWPSRSPALAMVGGIFLGLGLALMRLSRIAPVRGHRLGLHLVRARHAAAAAARLPLRRPARPIGIKLDTFTTAVIGFALNEAAFSAEIIRGGILSVNRNQTIAAAALRHGAVADAAAHHPAAGHARHPARHGQRHDPHDQGHLDRLGDLRQRADLPRPADRRPELQVLHRLRRGRHHLPGDDQRDRRRPGRCSSAASTSSSSASRRRSRLFGFSFGPAPDAIAGPRAATGCAGAPRRRPKPAARPRRGCSTPAPTGREAPTTTTARPSSSAATSGNPTAAARCCAASTSPSSAARSWSIMGPSGSGKSTLLRMVNHLEAHRLGRDHWSTASMSATRRSTGALKPTRDLAEARAEARIGMVFQHFNLFDHLTALENVMRGAGPRAIGEDPAKARETRAAACSPASASADHADHLPHRLSGGQQQRVAHRPRARHLAAADAVRRADLGARSGAGRRGARGAAPARRGGHDDDRRHPRDRASPATSPTASSSWTRASSSSRARRTRCIGNPKHERTRRFLRMVEREETAADA